MYKTVVYWKFAQARQTHYHETRQAAREYARSMSLRADVWAVAVEPLA